MGKKRGKKPKHQQHITRTHYCDSELDQESVIRRPSSSSEEDDDLQEHPEDETRSTDLPSKFSLYRESVQMPKGDISYLQKFFFMYVGGRVPLHLQEDFCGTALLNSEWLHTDSRRTAVGVDLDLETLAWCLENNFNKIGVDAYSRISLFHGNVLEPMEAKQIKDKTHNLMDM